MTKPARKAHKALQAVKVKGAEPVGVGPLPRRAPALSPHGSWLVLAIGDSWVQLDRKGRLARVIGEGSAEGAAVTDEGAVAFTRRPGALGREIWWSPALAVPPARLLGGDGWDYRDPAFSPDGRRLVCAAGRSGTPARLVAIDLESGRRDELPRGDDGDGTRADARPAFDPTGTQLFFEGRLGGERAVWVELPGGTVRRVSSGGWPAPLGGGLVVVEREVPGDPGGAARLWLVDSASGLDRELVEGDGRAPSAAAAGDKIRLAWVQAEGEQEVVWLGRVRTGAEPEEDRERERERDRDTQTGHNEGQR